MDSFSMSAAYQFVVMMVMLAEIDVWVKPLEIDLGGPVEIRRVNGGASHVGYPNISGFNGSIVIDGWLFGFLENRLKNVRDFSAKPTKAIPTGEEVPQDLSSVTNRVYRTARKQIGFILDMDAVEAAHRPVIEEFTVLGRSTGFWMVEWGEIDIGKHRTILVPVVYVEAEVHGTDVDIVRVRLQAEEYHFRDRLEVADIERLLSIDDKEFAGMSVEERIELVVRHSAVGEKTARRLLGEERGGQSEEQTQGPE